MIGLMTRYRKYDCTLAALAVARHLAATCRRFDIMNYGWRAGHIDSGYDNRVYDAVELSDDLTDLIWTAPVDSYFIEGAGARGIRSTLYTSWDQLAPYDEKVISAYTQVLVPSVMQAMQLKERFHLNNIAVMPYDSGLPHTRKLSNDTPDQIKLFMSLYGTQLGRIDLQAISMLDEVVSDNPKVYVTIACCKGLAKHTIQELKKIAKKHSGRWTFLPNKSWDDHAILMGQHDLTVWPAKFDGMGIVGITSLAMGTPVIAWDIMPINEYLTAGRNALLISCDVEYTWLGVPVVKPDYVEFDRVLRWLIDRPDALSELRKHTKERITHQTEDFKEGWEALLPPSI